MLFHRFGRAWAAVQGLNQKQNEQIPHHLLVEISVCGRLVAHVFQAHLNHTLLLFFAWLHHLCRQSHNWSTCRLFLLRGCFWPSMLTWSLLPSCKKVLPRRPEAFQPSERVLRWQGKSVTLVSAWPPRKDGLGVWHLGPHVRRVKVRTQIISKKINPKLLETDDFQADPFRLLRPTESRHGFPDAGSRGVCRCFCAFGI